jgi:hypothetical protein
MANFAKIGLDNQVTQVIYIDNIDAMNRNGEEVEAIGVAYLKKHFGHETWVQTSFNTFGNQHLAGKAPFRGNYAQVGGTYDTVKEVFIPPVIFPSWILNDNYLWEPPYPKPNDGLKYRWDEPTTSWVAVES